MTSKTGGILGIVRGHTRSQCVDDSLWKKLWTCPKTDKSLKEVVLKLLLKIGECTLQTAKTISCMEYKPSLFIYLFIYLFINLTNFYLLIIVVEVNVARDHTPWHTRSVALLLTRDGPVTEHSTCELTTLTTERHPGNIRTHNPSKPTPGDPHLRPRGHWNRLQNSTWEANVP